MVIACVLAVIAGLLASQLHHVWGASPALAAVLAASAFLKRRDVLIAGLGAILVRDVLVDVGWYTLVRLAAVLSVMGIAWLIRVGPTLRSLILGIVLASPVYHLILATGDWVLQFCTNAPRTPQGWWANLVGTLPYFQRTLVTDLLFTSGFLALYALGGYVVSLWFPAVLAPSSKAS